MEIPVLLSHVRYEIWMNIICMWWKSLSQGLNINLRVVRNNIILLSGNTFFPWPELCNLHNSYCPGRTVRLCLLNGFCLLHRMESGGQGVVLLTTFLAEAAWYLVKHEQESSGQPRVVAAVDTIHSRTSQQTHRIMIAPNCNTEILNSIFKIFF